MAVKVLEKNPKRKGLAKWFRHERTGHVRSDSLSLSTRSCGGRIKPAPKSCPLAGLHSTGSACAFRYVYIVHTYNDNK